MARPRIEQPEPLNKPALLFVEGTNDWHFFDRALWHLNIRDRVAIISYDGKDKLSSKLKDLEIGLNGNEVVRKLAIFRDADNSADDAFKSIAAALETRRWQPPTNHAAWATARDGLEVAGYILPDGQGQGELETLLHQALSKESVIGCIDSFLACLRTNGASIPTDHQQSKHRFFATVAALPDPDNKFGVLADRTPGFWSKPVFTNLLAFLRTI